MTQQGGKLKVTAHPCCYSSETDIFIDGYPLGNGDLCSIKRTSKTGTPFLTRFRRWAQTRSFEVAYLTTAHDDEEHASDAERILQVGNPEETPECPPGVIYRRVLDVERYGAFWFWFGVPESADKVVLLRFCKCGRLDLNKVKHAERVVALSRWKDIFRGTLR